jgi:ribosome-binding factor A
MREEIATFLANDVKDPRIMGLVTVTAVDITRDLRHAKVFVSVFGSESQRAATFDGLNNVATHLRGRVGRALRLRVAPEIKFVNDESVAHAAHIESLLAQVRQDPAAADAPADASDAARSPNAAPDDEGRGH